MAIFPDVDRLRDQVQAVIASNEYNVEDNYRTRGLCQKIARSHIMKNATCFMIIFNAIWIGIDTDWNHAPSLYYAAPMFQVVENLFCAFFTFEIVVRLLAFKRRRIAFRDGWFVFDFVLVMLMAWETWVMTALIALGILTSGLQNTQGSMVFRILRLLRLSRVLRIGRLLQKMPEFIFLVKSLYIAMRTVVSTLVFLLIIIYVFSIIFVQSLHGTPAGTDCFQNLPQAMDCLFVYTALSDPAEILKQISPREHLLYYLLALFYFVIGSLTLMNLLIGSLCEVVSVVSSERTESNKVDACKRKLTNLLRNLDETHDMRVSRYEFMNLLVHPEMVKVLLKLEVDVDAFLHDADVVWQDEVCDIETCLDILMQFRSSSGATVKDIIRLRRELLKSEGLCRRL